MAIAVGIIGKHDKMIEKDTEMTFSITQLKMVIF